MHYPEDELCSIWKKAKDKDGNDEIDNNTFVSIILDEELVQMMTVGWVETYSDFNGNETSITYTRRKHSLEAPWGEWAPSE